MYQSKHNSVLLIVPINIGMGLHVSTPSESSSGPQDTDPSDKVCFLHCGIPSATRLPSTGHINHFYTLQEKSLTEPKQGTA